MPVKNFFGEYSVLYGATNFKCVLIHSESLTVETEIEFKHFVQVVCTATVEQEDLLKSKLATTIEFGIVKCCCFQHRKKNK